MIEALTNTKEQEIKRTMFHALTELNWNEHRIIMALSAVAAKGELHQNTLTLSVDDFLKIIDLEEYDWIGMNMYAHGSVVDKQIWNCVMDVSKKEYLVLWDTGSTLIRWINKVTYDAESREVIMKIDPDMVDCMKDFTLEGMLPYDFVMSKDAITLLKSMRDSRKHDKTYNCSAIMVKPSLFKTRKADWREKRLLPAIAQIQKYIPINADVLESHADRVLVRCDYLPHGMEVLEKEEEVCNAIPEKLHPQRMKIDMQVLSEMRKQI
jgi:hypothetical protein